MRFESPDREPDFAPAPLRNTVGPVLFSVVLHGAVLGLFAREAFAPEAEAGNPEARPYVRVALVMRPPRTPENPPPEAEPVTQQEIEEQRAEAALAEAVPEPAVASVANIAPTADPEDEERAPAPSVQAWTPARVRAAIETTSGERLSTVTETWVIDCILEKKEHGTRDCEQQQEEQDYFTASARAGQDAGGEAFAVITQPQRYARLVEQFRDENAVLEGLIAAPGGVGALAAERYFMNREYVFYLTGNGQNPVFAAMGNFTADPLGGPQWSLPGNILFSCKKKPCNYEFNGFKVEAPQVEPEEGAFRVVPTLFGSGR